MLEQLRQLRDDLEDLYYEAVDSDESNDMVSYLDDSLAALEDAIRNTRTE